MRFTTLTMFVGMGLLLTHCGSVDSAVVDTQMPTQQSALTGKCPPEQGNELNVGGACTKGGKQCARTKSTICTIDAWAEAPYTFCTRPCVSDAQCGTGASCRPDPRNSLLHGCVPNVCL